MWRQNVDVLLSREKWSFSGAWRRAFRDSCFFHLLVRSHSPRARLISLLSLRSSLSSSRPVEGSCGRWRASCGHAGLMTPPCDRFFVCGVLFRVRVSTATEPFVIKLIYLPSKVYYFKRIASELILCKFVQKFFFTRPSEANTISSFCSGLLNHVWKKKPKPKLCSGAL